MSEARLARARGTLPAGYQFGDAKRLSEQTAFDALDDSAKSDLLSELWELKMTRDHGQITPIVYKGVRSPDWMTADGLDEWKRKVDTHAFEPYVADDDDAFKECEHDWKLIRDAPYYICASCNSIRRFTAMP